MAKGQKRSNREIKKPKQIKTKPDATLLNIKVSTPITPSTRGKGKSV